MFLFIALIKFCLKTFYRVSFDFCLVPFCIENKIISSFNTTMMCKITLSLFYCKLIPYNYTIFSLQVSSFSLHQLARPQGPPRSPRNLGEFCHIDVYVLITPSLSTLSPSLAFDSHPENVS